jgi:hypothetical protein
MFARYPRDMDTWEMTEQYMFGDDFIVMPILNPSTYKTDDVDNNKPCSTLIDTDGICPLLCSEPYFVDVKVYIPSHSEWVYLWSGDIVGGGVNGRYVLVRSPIGNPPVFFLQGSSYGEDVLKYVKSRGLHALYARGGVIELDSCLSDLPCSSKKGDDLFPEWVKWFGVTQVSYHSCFIIILRYFNNLLLHL